MNAALVLLGSLCAANPGPPGLMVPPPGYSLPADPAASAPTPNWNKIRQEACPGPAVFPFHRMPQVTRVPACDGDRDDAMTDVPNPAAIWIKEFHQAAHIPIPRYRLDSTPGTPPEPGEGLVIYEGMRLTVNRKTGQYDLTFAATVPNMPVAVRLQLEFQQPGTAQTYRMTLPPIRLQPAKDAQPGDYEAMTFHVAHRGYSSLFLEVPKKPTGVWSPDQGPRGLTEREICPPRDPITCQWELKRIGTARFGTPVAIDDPNRY